jgi:hypothetical protein
MRAKAMTLGNPDADDPPRPVEGEYTTRELPLYVQHFVGGELVDPETVERIADPKPIHPAAPRG